MRGRGASLLGRVMWGRSPVSEWPKDVMRPQNVVEIVATTFKNREHRIIETATVESYCRVLAYLRARGLLDLQPLHITEGFD